MIKIEYALPVMKLLRYLLLNFLLCTLALAQAPTSAPQSITQKQALEFLLNDLPPRDAGSISSEQNLKNVQLAIQARDRAPWKEEIPDEVFLNCVLPYC